MAALARKIPSLFSTLARPRSFCLLHIHAHTHTGAGPGTAFPHNIISNFCHSVTSRLFHSRLPAFSLAQNPNQPTHAHCTTAPLHHCTTAHHWHTKTPFLSSITTHHRHPTSVLFLPALLSSFSPLTYSSPASLLHLSLFSSRKRHISLLPCAGAADSLKAFLRPLLRAPALAAADQRPTPQNATLNTHRPPRIHLLFCDCLCRSSRCLLDELLDLKPHTMSRSNL